MLTSSGIPPLEVDDEPSLSAVSPNRASYNGPKSFLEAAMTSLDIMLSRLCFPDDVLLLEDDELDDDDDDSLESLDDDEEELLLLVLNLFSMTSPYLSRNCTLTLEFALLDVNHPMIGLCKAVTNCTPRW